VAITFEVARAADQVHGHRVDQHVLVGDVGYSPRISCAISRHSRDEERMFALSTEVSFRRRWRARAKGVEEARDLRLGIEERVDGLAPGGCRAPLARLAK